MKRIFILTLLFIGLFALTGCGATPTKFDDPPALKNNQRFYDAMTEYFTSTADFINGDDAFVYEIPFYQYSGRAGNEYTNEWATINRFVEQKCKQQKGIVSYPKTSSSMKRQLKCVSPENETRIYLEYKRAGRIIVRLADQEQIKRENKEIQAERAFQVAQMNACFARNMRVNDTTDQGVIVELTDSEALVVDVKTEVSKWHYRLALAPVSNKLGRKVIQRDPSCLTLLKKER